MQPGDVIRSVDGQQVNTVEDYFSVLRAEDPGDTITVQFLRDRREREVKVTLAERPAGSG